MGRRQRIYCSAAQRSEIWDRWQAGQPMSSIGRRFDRDSSSFSRSYRRLAVSARRIGVVPSERLVCLKGRRFLVGSACAVPCGRSRVIWDDPLQPSAVKSSAMVGLIAIEQAGPIRLPGIDRGYPSSANWLVVRLRRTVSTLLQRQWSPEQIAGWLKRRHPAEPEKQVSHETIYHSLYIQTRDVLKSELLEHLRAKRTVRSRHASMK